MAERVASEGGERGAGKGYRRFRLRAFPDRLTTTRVGKKKKISWKRI